MPKMFLVCLFVRYMLAYIARTFPQLLKIIGLMALLVSIGFILIYAFNLRPTGFEAGGVIWWNSVRPLHALLYAIFAYLALVKESPNAWLVLLADAVLGTAVFGLKYSNLMF